MAVQEIEIADVHTVVMIVAGMGIVSVIAVMTEAIADPEIEIDAEVCHDQETVAAVLIKGGRSCLL